MRAPYRPRVVLRASEAAAWTGAVVVEWLNVSGGVDAVPEWASTHRHARATRRALHSADSGHHPSTCPSRRRRLGDPRPARLRESRSPPPGSHSFIRSPAEYLQRFTADTDATIKAGFPLPPRSRPLLAFAEPSPIPG